MTPWPPPMGPPVWATGRRQLVLGRRPCIMGVVNVTPDSFSDGGRFLDPAAAAAQALEMAVAGADIIDLGGESTRPGAPPVSAQEELDRVLPVLQRLAGTLHLPISIDTSKAEVARAALAAGAEIVNDISGLTFDPAMAQTVAEAGCGLVVMHTRGRPAEMQRDTVYADLTGEVIAGLQRSLAVAAAAGIPLARIVVDPGIGFGKDAAGNLELLRRLPELANLGRPVLVGTSRKSFIGKVLDREPGERLLGTAATVVLALAAGATIFRVHDVAAMRDALDMAAAVLGRGTAGP